jgi:hypothetical protein
MEPDRATALRAAERTAVGLHAVAIAWVQNMPTGFYTRKSLSRALYEKFPAEGKSRCAEVVKDCIDGRAIRWAGKGEVPPYKRTRRLLIGTGLASDGRKAALARERARSVRTAAYAGHVSPDREQGGRLHGVTHW